MSKVYRLKINSLIERSLKWVVFMFYNVNEAVCCIRSDLFPIPERFKQSTLCSVFRGFKSWSGNVFIPNLLGDRY